MGNQLPNHSLSNGRHSSTVTLRVTLEPTPTEDIKGADRAATFRYFIRCNEKKREELAHWLEKQPLYEKVERISKANVFDMLHIDVAEDAAPRLRRALRRAPGVVDVAIEEDFKVELLDDDEG